jgi:hypothetical protein
MCHLPFTDLRSHHGLPRRRREGAHLQWSRPSLLLMAQLPEQQSPALEQRIDA